MTVISAIDNKSCRKGSSFGFVEGEWIAKNEWSNWKVYPLILFTSN